MNKKIKELREMRGLSQAQVADFIGISRQMYNKYENEEIELSLKAVKALCLLYAISYDELLGKISEESELSENTSQKKSFNNYNVKNVDGLFVSSPKFFYGSSKEIVHNSIYGTTNVLAQILELLPKLLYSEKAKLLTTVAQSMSNDVEAGQFVRENRQERLNREEQERPSYEEFSAVLEHMEHYAKKTGITSHGIKWTREELHER